MNKGLSKEFLNGYLVGILSSGDFEVIEHESFARIGMFRMFTDITIKSKITGRVCSFRLTRAKIGKIKQNYFFNTKKVSDVMKELS